MRTFHGIERMIVRPIAVLVVLLGLAGCPPPGPDPEPPASCPEKGVEGCPCLEGAIQCRGDGLVCASGFCVDSVACTPGTLDCACNAGDTCSGGLACVNDTCATVNCPEGTAGCPCAAGDSCSDTGTTCTNNACVPVNCSDGERGCACRTGAPACDANLACSTTNTCVDAPCPAGTLTCACRDDGTCGLGLTCSGSVCTQVVPTTAACFLPCRSGAVVGGVYRSCSPSGLMRFEPGEACLDDGNTATPNPVCTDSNCVIPGQAAPTCASAVDCPDFQACISGTCRSQCEYDGDCGSGRSCHLQVCRSKCNGAAAACGGGLFCSITDGQNGVCMPTVPPGDDAQLQTEGAFRVELAEPLTFSNIRVGSEFTITNTSPNFQEFKVRKVEHTEVTAAGPVTDTTTPLFWLQMGPPGQTQQAAEVTIGVEAGGTATVAIAGAHNETIPLWTGTLEVSNPKLGKRSVPVSYSLRPEGRWQGRMYFFGNFPDRGVDAWRQDPSMIANVGNAFIRKWAEFKSGAISLREFYAVLTATETESWRFDNVKARCPTPANPDPNRGCYLFENSQGYGLYSSSLDSAPIPTGVVDLPIGMNLKAASAGQPNVLSGKILTGESLHYAGDPAVTIRFAGDPSTCMVMNGATCVVPVTDLDASVVVGGRYAMGPTGTCNAVGSATDFERTSIPWLVPGFERSTSVDAMTGVRYKHECRDVTLPYADDEFKSLNASLVLSNPVPDGRPRKRSLELVDGALINQTTIIILFRERFQSFLSDTDEDILAYGYITLEKGAANLDPADYVGNQQVDTRTLGKVNTLSCSQEMLTQSGVAAVAGNEDALVNALIRGARPSMTPPPTLPLSSVHYYCEDTGRFDGGPNATVREPCPAGSRVTFFHLTSEPPGGIHTVACQATRTCQQTLNTWIANGTYGVTVDPAWRCQDENQAYCDSNRVDVRSGKVFFGPAATDVVFVPLQPQVDEAFRYKTRFRNRTGGTLAFAPSVCIPNSNAIPYCYDPQRIEEIEDRVDCVLSIYNDPARRAALSMATRQLAEHYLSINFSWEEETVAGQSLPLIHDGFERLNAELLVMLGDDAYTSAFASRFDLAGSGVASFEGTLFEVDGINVSGAAGFEMHNLYLATQYYQQALDRFYKLGPALFGFLEQLRTSPDNPSLDVAEAYFGRLIRASSQKTRAFSEVAKRYMAFNRPDLARRVIERAYTGAYLESVVLSRMMMRLIGTAGIADRAQIIRNAEQAQRLYRAALLDMRDAYSNISDDINFFGFKPDYIPFPALEPLDTNAFSKAHRIAAQRKNVAYDKELAALSQNRSYEVDSAAFQSELTSIRNNYENQLAGLCGTFIGDDGAAYPAIRKYAHLGEAASALGDPCGRVGNGQIHEAMVGLEIGELDFHAVELGHDTVLEQIEIERERVNAQCELTLELADYRYEVDGEVHHLHNAIAKSRNTIKAAKVALGSVKAIVSSAKCIIGGGMGTVTDCLTKALEMSLHEAAEAALKVVTVVNDRIIREKQNEIAELNQASARWVTEQQCTSALIDSDATVKNMMLSLQRFELDALRADYQLRLGFSNLEQLRHKATALAAEQEESEALAVNIQSAQNNPNVRIYKNDSIITADRTFEAALREAYKATKVFEYYTSQSYAALGKLFLVRMVSAGDNSLEQYLFELEDAFLDFQEQFGNPDSRVQIISLRDDILQIPRLDGNRQPLSQSARVELLRRALGDPGRLDDMGHINFPFATTTNQLSPLTRNHKLQYVEAEFVGSDVGDPVGRVYLRQTGTGTVTSVVGRDAYYAFPERTAVVNALFNGQRVYPPGVYQNARLRDLPVANSRWELAINQRDETVNQDVNLQSLTDIRLYLYYSDFTLQ